MRPSADSDSDSESSYLSSSTDDESVGKVKVHGTEGESPRQQGNTTPRQKKKIPKDDYEEKTAGGTVITLHTTEGSQPVDQIYMDPRGKEAKAAFMEGYKVAIQIYTVSKFCIFILLLLSFLLSHK